MGTSREVQAWLARYESPMKDVVLRIREIVLGADARIEECIKWQAPTFTYRGNLASFFPKSRQHASLMFHLGAKIPGEHPLLMGAGDAGRVLKLDSVAAADAARPGITKLVRAWCDWRDAELAAPATKAVTKKTTTKTKTTKTTKKKPSPTARRRR